MSVALQWYDAERTILVVEFTGKWKWDDFYIQQDRINHELNSFTYDIDVMTRAMDDDAHNYVPLNTLTQMPIVVRRTNTRVRLVALITQSGMWRTLDPLLRQISPQYAERIVIVR